MQQLNQLRIAIFSLLTLSLAFLVACGEQHKNKDIEIVIFQKVDYDLIKNMRASFRDEIMKSEYARTHKITFLPVKDAHDDPNLLSQLADNIIKDNPSLIYVLGTPAAQAIAQRTKSIPIVQGAVTDPVAAGLARNWDGSGNNYAASTDYPPVESAFKLLKKVLPTAKRIGVVYNSGEDNSVALMNRVRPICKDLGFDLIEKPVINTTEVVTSTTALVGKADLIYVTTDNTVIAALSSLIEVARDNKIPVMCSTQEDVKNGALFAFGSSYDELSRIAARIAIKILQGENSANIPIASAENPYLYWNYGVAKQLGISLPTEIVASVHSWYENGKEIESPYPRKEH